MAYISQHSSINSQYKRTEYRSYTYTLRVGSGMIVFASESGPPLVTETGAFSNPDVFVTGCLTEVTRENYVKNNTLCSRHIFT